MAIRTVNTILVGLGAVNVGLLRILASRKQALADQYQVDFRIVAVADSSGVAVHESGWDYEELLQLKKNLKHAKQFEGYRPGIQSSDIVATTPAELLIESSPGNIQTGMPGLGIVRSALHAGLAVVLANKTPLIFAFDELNKLAAGRMRWSATVCGGLPVINVLQRDLKLAYIKRMAGVLNATSNFVLQELAAGRSMVDAIYEAQRIGAAEADPSHDLHGHDTANKLFIILNSATNFSGSIHDIPTAGIQHTTPDDLRKAESQGQKIKLVAEALNGKDGWQVSVQPRWVDATSFIGTCDGWEMGVEIETDLYEKVYLKNYEADPLGTSAAVLRDALDLFAH